LIADASRLTLRPSFALGKYETTLAWHENAATTTTEALRTCSRGQLALRVRGDETVDVIDLGPPAVIISGLHVAGTVLQKAALCSDLQLVALATFGAVHLFDLVRKRTARNLRFADDDIIALAFCKSALVALGARGELHAYLQPGGFKPKRLSPDISRGVLARKTIAVSPDGSTLAVAKPDHHIDLWSLRDETLRQSLRGHRDPVLFLRLSSDERRPKPMRRSMRQRPPHATSSWPTSAKRAQTQPACPPKKIA
jgi:WD40 repeat protein